MHSKGILYTWLLSLSPGEELSFAADHYIYNVGVKNLASGTYKLTISEANGGATHDE
jgi:hypothetical protein